MMKVPGDRPFITPPSIPKEAKPPEEAKAETKRPLPPPPPRDSSRGPEMDSKAIAIRMAIIAAEAKDKELSFEDIIERAIQETGMTNPEAAVGEANRKLQEEIEEVLEQIKMNKDLIEEAEAWQEFGKMLDNMNEEQASAMLDLIEDSVKNI
jgi:hypothetical protein